MGDKTPVDDALLMAVERTKMKLRRAAKLARRGEAGSSDHRGTDAGPTNDLGEDDIEWQRSG